MADAVIHGAFDKSARVDGVVAIVRERIADRVGNNDRSGEVDNRFDVMLANEIGDQRLVASVADHEWRTLGHSPVVAGGKVIEHDDGFAGIEQLKNHVAADVAGSAGNEDRHGFDLFLSATGLLQLDEGPVILC